MPNSLEVAIHGRSAGTVTATGTTRAGHVQQAVFSYHPDYIESANPTPLSVSVPLQPGEHEVGAWIDGLLPDNPFVRQRWQLKYNVESSKAMELLGLPVGWDCAGAVQFCRKEELATMLSRDGGTKSLTNTQMAAIIKRLEEDKAAWSSVDDRSSFSLAGAQSKLALRYEEVRWSIPYGTFPTTHILKPSIPGFPDQHIIEHLSQRTAMLLGISSAKTQCVQIKRQGALLVERYDRVATPDGDYARVHQEDMCQALGVEPDYKYQADGGPGVERIANILWDKSFFPETDIRLFRDALIYNWLIVGTDAHAKNYGLILSGNQVRMAPLYDMCSILPYLEDLNKRSMQEVKVNNLKLAMKIGRDYSILKSDYRAAWERTARLLRLPESEVVSRATELAIQLPEALKTAVAELPPMISNSPYVKKLREEVEKRAAHCRYLDRMLKPSVQGRFDFDTKNHPSDRSMSQQIGLPPEQSVPAGVVQHIQPVVSSVVRGAQCSHVGVRSKKRCRLFINHKSPHRY